MKRFASTIFLILLTVLILVAQKGQIEGRIFNASNNQPLAFANIIVTGTNIGSTSDLDGKFMFTGIEPEEQTSREEKDKYGTLAYLFRDIHRLLAADARFACI